MMHFLRVSKAFPGLALLAFAGFTCWSGAALAQADAGANTAEANFKMNCTMCHGPDGAGSAFGKRLGVPDLHSKEVQSTPSAALAQIIAQGKKNMPAFGTRLDSAQIQGLIEYIRQLHATPDTPK